MLDWNPQPPYTAEQLLQVIRILRDPENGCPWDKVQTHASIRKNFLEETCEALEAIDADDAVLLREELGDVLMQVVFHAAMEEERGRFTFEDVCPFFRPGGFLVPGVARLHAAFGLCPAGQPAFDPQRQA